MIHLNCSTSNSRFQQGINTIILPRAIALDCKLNCTLSHLGSISSTNALYGADFYYTNSSQSVSSAHIVATISKSLTAAKAEELLLDLTKNASGGRVGNNVTISTTSALYLLHLPRDVLSSVPSLVDNAGLGNGPNYLDPLDVLTNIAQFAFDFLVFVASGGLFLLMLHMAEMGLKKLGQMLSAAATVVKNAVDEMAKALNNFVDWILDAIMDIATQMLEALTSPIESMYNTYMSGVAGAIMKCKSDVQGKGYVTTSSKDSLTQALNGDLYWAIIALSIVVVAVILIITGMTNIFSFLLMIAISLVIGFIIENAFNLVSDVDDTSLSSTGKEIAEEDGSLFSNPSNLNSALVTCGVDSEQISDTQTKLSAELALTIISAAIAQFASKVTLVALASSGWMYAWGMISIIAGFMGILFGGLGATGDYDPCVEFVFGYSGLAYTIESLVFGGRTMIGTKGFDLGVGLFGTGLGAISCILTIWALIEANNGGQ